MSVIHIIVYYYEHNLDANIYRYTKLTHNKNTADITLIFGLF